MAQLFKSLLLRLFDRTTLLALYVLRYHSFLSEVGWFESWRRGQSVDKDGSPIPWITYPAHMFLSARLRADMDVFEFGSGHSTLWWASKVRSVKACEHDRSWFEQIKSRLPLNAEIVLRNLKDNYPGAVLEDDRKFDVVIIDGRERVNCLKACVGALTARGVVILDNSDREEYIEGIAVLKEGGFRELEFIGFGPILPSKWTTSIFYRPCENVLEI